LIAAYPSVVDQDINAPKRLDDLVKRRRGGRIVSHVKLVDVAGAPHLVQSRYDFLSGLTLACTRHGHAGASTSKRECNPPANAARASRHYHYLTLELCHSALVTVARTRPVPVSPPVEQYASSSRKAPYLAQPLGGYRTPGPRHSAWHLPTALAR